MRIQHNILAMNVARQLGIVNGRLTRNTERLSSGYRINRAADDAAGLSISEKMRKQIRGLMQGIANAEDGISLCQVADGALNEVHDMLQRMNELAVKSANGTLSPSDRKSINDEVQMLKQEIDRIGQTTKFNEIYIFNDGDITSSTSGSSSSSSGNKPLTEGRFFQLLGNNVSNTGYMQEGFDGTNLTSTNSTFDPNVNPGDNPFVSVHINFGAIEPNLKDLVGCQFYVNCCTDDCPKTVYFTDDIGINTTISEHDYAYPPDYYLSEIKIGMKKSDGSYYSNAEEFNKYIVDTLRPLINPYDNNSQARAEHVQFAYMGKTLYLLDVDNNNWTQANKEAAYFCDSSNIFGPANNNSSTAIANKSQNSIWIQSGADAGDGMFLNIGSVSTASLGISSLDVSTEKSATHAIDLVSNAISIVSAQRSRIGAYQNRLEHTIKNEENIVENTTAAESKIRDTDIAKEMLEYSKNQILTQVGQSLLAQANQTNQGILKLIGG